MIEYENFLKETIVYKTIKQDIESGRLYHAYMIVGEDNIALNNICDLLCRQILCKNNDCGQCLDCIRVEQHSHQAIYKPVDNKMNELRKFIQNAEYAFEDSDYKIMYIPDFDKIALNAQNIFLAPIENPLPNVIYLLGVGNFSNVLQTIKSRCKKLFIERFSNQVIRQILESQNIKEDEIERAVDYSFGSITRALSIVKDNNFIEDYSLMVDLMTNLATSKQVVSFLSKLNLKGKYLLKYLDIIESILNLIMTSKASGESLEYREIRRLESIYSLNMVVNIAQVVNEARRKLDSNCNEQIVAEWLLMKILEVKYLCR